MDDKEKEKLEFLWKTHSYLNEYIRFADQKAGFFIAVSSALLGVLFARKSHLDFMHARFTAEWSLATFGYAFWSAIVLCSFFLLALTALLGMLAILPRLWKRAVPGAVAGLSGSAEREGNDRALEKIDFIFWEDVLRFSSASEHLGAFEQTAAEGKLNLTLSRHIRVLASVASHKYQWIDKCTRTFAFAALFACMPLLFGDAPKEPAECSLRLENADTLPQLQARVNGYRAS